MRTFVPNYMKLSLVLVAVLTVIASPLELFATDLVSVIPPPSPMEELVQADNQRSKQLPGQFALAVDTVYFNFDKTLEGWSFATSPDTVAITYADTACNQVGRLDQTKYPFDLYWDNGTLKYVAYHHGYYEYECDYEFWSKAIWAPVGSAWDGSKRLEARIYNKPEGSYSVWARFGYQKAGDPNTYYPGGSAGWFSLANGSWTTIFLDEPSEGEFDNLDAIAITVGAYYNEGDIYVDWVRGISQRITTLHVPSVKYPTIQAAIDASTDGDTILVDSGTYTGYGNRDLYIQGRSIVLKSELGPELTIIDCEGGTGNTHTGLSVFYDTTGGVVVDGFTFRRAYGDPGYINAGIYLYSSNSIIRNCIIGSNTLHGVYCSSSNPIIDSCVFVGNSGDYGGALYCGGSSSPTLTGCLFDGNFAQQGGAIYYGEGSAALLTNCTFVNNSADSGGVIWFGSENDMSSITDCLLAFSSKGEAIYVEYGTLSLSCCDIYGNAGGDWVGYMANQAGVNGNFSHDPLFCDFANSNYQITENSTCAPANNTCKSLIGAYDVGCGAIEIVLSPTSIDFSATEGEGSPPPDTLTITNGGGGVLNWSLNKNAAWLNLVPTQGTAPSAVIVSADISGLIVGEYRDTIVVFASDAANSPQYVPVALRVISANRPPEFVQVCSDTVLVEGQKFECEIVASDPDGDSISFSCEQCPVGSELTSTTDTTVLFSFEPDFRHVDSSYTVIIEASDGDMSAVDSFAIDSVVNRQLVVNSIEPQPGEAQDILISWKPIQIQFNEAVQDTSVDDTSNVHITSKRGDSLHYYYVSQQRSLMIDNDSGYFRILDTIVIVLDTGIVDLAVKPLDQKYVDTFYTGAAVFPGDGNNDGVVDERDILPMGLYWNNEGPSRPDSGSFSWGIKPAHIFAHSRKWTPLASVYSDADGSGVVDAFDICGVTENWAQTHSQEGVNKSSMADLAMVLKQLGGGVLRQMYEALINCPDGEGKAAVMKTFESLLGEESTENLPVTYELYQNYPNPFNPYTTIKFYLPQSGPASLSIYNIMGQKVAVLLDGYMEKGYGEFVWDGTDLSGKPVASGIYFYRFESGSTTITKRMMLLK